MISDNLAYNLSNSDDEMEHKSSEPEPEPKPVPESDSELSISTIDIVEETVIELLKQSIADADFENKFQLTLDNDVVDMFHKIMASSPNAFVDIQKSLNSVVLDGKINSEDIPQLIVLVKGLYQTIVAVKNVKVSASKMTELVGGVIKIAFHVLVKKDKINLAEDKQDAFLYQFDELLDSCVSLLSFTASIKPVGCFKKLFNFTSNI
tara:strand:+ start:1721 stop:2341 length:621 start_codon:yes stop_codon:yes gene_type:complete